ncbi:hypothetical protein C8R45DRAFT_59619 [Mycena sanguinolenta]|nr:hypothetical protein C8R45DRAFT_59619 [Mycena sanguinolenta]
MDASFRGMFLASAGVLFASIGFTLSVLSTFLRLLWPNHWHPTRGAAVTSTASIRRRRSTIRRLSKRRRSHVPTPDSSIISSPASTSTSLESTSLESTASVTNEPRLHTFHTIAHDRVVSEPTTDDRPDFRNTAVRRHRRSDSAPPSPAPWASSHFDDVDASKRISVDDTVTALNRDGNERRSSLHFNPARKSSLEYEDEHVAKSTGLSFLHRKKSRKASGGTLTAEPLPLIERKKSQLFAPLLHRRLSQDVDVNHRFSTEEESHTERPSQDSARVVPKRSQTLRTQPYQAPYFFPAPGSVEADSYLPPRRKPVRSKTLAPDET